MFTFFLNTGFLITASSRRDHDWMCPMSLRPHRCTPSPHRLHSGLTKQGNDPPSHEPRPVTNQVMNASENRPCEFTKPKNPARYPFAVSLGFTALVPPIGSVGTGGRHLRGEEWWDGIRGFQGFPLRGSQRIRPASAHRLMANLSQKCPKPQQFCGIQGDW